MKGMIQFMKTIAVLCLGAAFLCAQNSSSEETKNKRPYVPPTIDRAARTHSQSAPAARAQRHVHKPTVPPAAPALTTQQKDAAALPSVPAGAEEVGPNLYHYTDAQGKSWMYRKSPFGVSKWEGKPGDEQPAVDKPSSMTTTATDLGDSVRFQRVTPFGPQTWTRKKSELTEEEKSALALQENAKQAAAGTKPADASKPPEKQ